MHWESETWQYLKQTLMLFGLELVKITVADPVMQVPEYLKVWMPEKAGTMLV